MTQSEAILAALQSGDRLTALDCLTRFQCMRAASRVRDLRALGHDIRTETITTPTGKRVAQYHYVAPKAPLYQQMQLQEIQA